MPKLLSERKKLCDEGKLHMCNAEYDGSWLPYKVPLNEVTYDWLLEELTYDDCERKEEIIQFIKDKFRNMEREIYNYRILKGHWQEILKYMS
jgi:hypothetical protein